MEWLSDRRSHFIAWLGSQSRGFHKRDDFDFDIVNFPFLDGDIPRSTSYGVYIFLNLFD